MQADDIDRFTMSDAFLRMQFTIESLIAIQSYDTSMHALTAYNGRHHLVTELLYASQALTYSDFPHRQSCLLQRASGWDIDQRC